MTIFTAPVDYLGVLAAAVASFVFGSVWYMALAKPWMAAIGKTKEDVAGQSPVVFAVAFIAQLVMAWLLAGLIGHLAGDAPSVQDGLTTAFSLWLGFVATTLIVNHGFQGQRRSLTAIDGGHWLGVMLIQAAVICLLS